MKTNLIDVLRQHNAQLTLIEDRLWLIHRQLRVPEYDFDAHLECPQFNA